jgi:DNA-binding transcriptional MerR regulator
MQETKSAIPKSATNNDSQDNEVLPMIPEKRYFTISEAALLCGVKPHVLRYWEQEFLQLKPSKRRGNRRYYQHKDVIMIRQIKKLLYHSGFTIEGARAQLSNTPMQQTTIIESDAVVKKMIADLESVLENLKALEPV